MPFDARWRFREMNPGEINIDPIEEEFFTTEAIGSVTDALVREAIQNSLDAGSGEGPVTVRFSFSGPATPEADTARRQYLDGLFPHLLSSHSGLQDIPVEDEAFSHLLIEDYHTRGLQGDVRQFDDLDDDETRNDFFYFWRNIGRTRKTSTDLGRWGLGKTVFQAVSRINAILGITVRRDDGRMMLMGQSALKIHKLDGRRYAPYGFFGVAENGLPLPVEDTDFLARFAVTFAMNRDRKPGLSILIPFPDREVTYNDCLVSAVRHYFYPILAAGLIVEFRSAGKTTRLDDLTLEKFFKKSKNPAWRHMGGLLDFARWSIRQEKKRLTHLQAPSAGRAPKLREALFDPEALAELRDRFNSRARVGFHVPVSIQKADSRDFLPTGFFVFVEIDDKLDRAEDHFIRQGITIPEVSSLRHKGMRAIVSVTDPVLSGFLGDAENPAHTEWERNSKKFKRKYRLGPSTLDFIKSSPREIVKILTRPRKGRDVNLLRHLFALPTTEPGAGTRGDQPGSGEEEGPRSPAVPYAGGGTTATIQIQKIKGGFALTPRADNGRVPPIVTIRMAYEVRSGNPFKQYTRLDFDLSAPPLKVQTRGARLVMAQLNLIQLWVRNTDFRITVTGFDPHRDLRVRVTP